MIEGKHSSKIPRVIELRQTGKTWDVIGTELDIPERSLFNLRHTEGFLKAANSIWLDLWADIKKQRGIDTNYNLDQAIKNQLKMFMLLSGTSLDGLLGSEKVNMECDESCPFYEDRSQERREKSEYMLKQVLQIQPWQYERAINHAMDRPYEHIGPDWKREIQAEKNPK